MSRSNAPLALSVVKVTVPGDVIATAQRLAAFDSGGFGFSHDFTWNSMTTAMRGVLDPASVSASLFDKHPRVRKCVEGLCWLGKQTPLPTKAFADFPESGIRPVTQIEWGPNVTVRAKATCWYIDAQGNAVIALLQPRKAPYSPEELAVYVKISRHAFCKGDWASALTHIVDLSGDDENGVFPTIIDQRDLPKIKDDLVAEYVRTYMAAKSISSETAVKRQPKRKDTGSPDLFDPR